MLGAHAISWRQFLSTAVQKPVEQETDFESRIGDEPVAQLLEVKSKINDNTQAICVLPLRRGQARVSLVRSTPVASKTAG